MPNTRMRAKTFFYHMMRKEDGCHACDGVGGFVNNGIEIDDKKDEMYFDKKNQGRWYICPACRGTGERQEGKSCNFLDDNILHRGK